MMAQRKMMVATRLKRFLADAILQDGKDISDPGIVIAVKGAGKELGRMID